MKHLSHIFFLMAIGAVMFPMAIRGWKITAPHNSIAASSSRYMEITLHRCVTHRDDTLQIPTNLLRVVARESSLCRESVLIQPRGLPGIARITSRDGLIFDLTLTGSGIDSDSDGYPDCAELKTAEDRKAFRDWFVRVAESQLLSISSLWHEDQRDCAGLVRFAYREALKKHDDEWHRQSGIGVDKNLRDVRAFNYPHIPELGDRLFRVQRGSFTGADDFSSFANAMTLFRFSMVPVGRDIQKAKKGDLLFFFRHDESEEPYHIMIVAPGTDGTVYLVYHTGSDTGMKRVTPDYLENSFSFRPVAWNPAFLGVYRFSILE